MKRILLATAASALLATAATAEPVNLGIILGFTGPLESITPGMAASAELAIKEASDSGKLPGGITLDPGPRRLRPASTPPPPPPPRSSSSARRTSPPSSAPTAPASPPPSPTTSPIPAGVVMVSPSATSPALTTIEDNGFFFRTAPSDARQGEILAALVKEKGITEVAVTYTNNDYGKGLADAFATAFEAAGGTVADQRRARGRQGRLLRRGRRAPGLRRRARSMVLGYVDQGGVGIVQASLDTGAFESFFFADGMYGQSLIDKIGDEINGKVIGTLPGVSGEAADKFAALAKADGMDPTGTYVPESYDAAALIALSIAASGSADRTGIRDKMMDVANAPGEKIYAGELAKGLELAAAGTDIDYVGATGVELVGPGEAAGSYRVYDIVDNAAHTLEYR